ncbi:hypothetical protein HNP84_008135 [Thermocatellispora tengchongensis]|uniref:Uncharacterized protein n=1 Tax=Thermocatellispora tengchongensis TaxID=1073253 RepID=A0A840PKQ7_9ACTN|nr:hypothetical protein [Thermocatellispora tengchongensis]
MSMPVPALVPVSVLMPVSVPVPLVVPVLVPLAVVMPLAVSVLPQVLVFGMPTCLRHQCTRSSSGAGPSRPAWRAWPVTPFHIPYLI